MKLRKYSAGAINSNPFHYKSVAIMIKFVNLNADAKLKKISGHQFVDEATSIDNEYVAHFSKETLPEKMNFYRIFVDAPNELVYENYYTVYSDWHSGSMWNHARLGRIQLNTMIYNETRKLLHEGQHLHPKMRQKMQETLRKCSTTMNHLALDICASVPQLAGYASLLGDPSSMPPNSRFSHLPEDYQTPSRRMGEPNKQDFLASHAVENPSFGQDHPGPGIGSFNTDQHPPTTSSGMSLLWPLYTIGVLDNVSQELKLWAINRLEYLGRTMGLGQSLMIAKALRERGKIVMYKGEFEELMGRIPKRAVVEDVDEEAEYVPGSEFERRNLELVRNTFYPSDIQLTSELTLRFGRGKSLLLNLKFRDVSRDMGIFGYIIYRTIATMIPKPP